jgi:DNA (cytosine-5)-methyltransferase 1
MTRQLNCADLFCGAGGTSCGAEMTGGARVRFAVNHWQTAVDTHSANFPDAKHVNSRLDQVNPGECERPDILFASPECTHHSRARGGKPTSDQQRSGGWDVVRWVEYHRPSWLVVENVAEWEHWGPVGDNGIPLKSKRGAFFHAWVQAIQAAGYRVDWRRLNAADYGAATSRDRLFVVARRGNRAPVFPEPTHSRTVGGELPGMGLPRWRAAAEVIDWSIPCPSVFTRRRPLAPKTLARIEAGLKRFVGPFVTQWDNQGGGGDYCRPLAGPIGTLVTKANMGIAIPYTVEVNHGGDDHRTGDLSDTIGTLSTKNGRGLAIPFTIGQQSGSVAREVDQPVQTIATGGFVRLAVPYIVPHFGERQGQSPRCHSINAASPAITGQGAGSLCVPYLCHYYGTENTSPVTDPVDTITTRDRHAVVCCQLGLHNDSNVAQSAAERSLRDTMRRLGVCDIGFRMLQNHELSAAQGFPSDYTFCGGKADVTRQIGNSVSPPVAKAITQAILGA